MTDERKCLECGEDTCNAWCRQCYAGPFHSICLDKHLVSCHVNPAELVRVAREIGDSQSTPAATLRYPMLWCGDASARKPPAWRCRFCLQEFEHNKNCLWRRLRAALGEK